MSVRYTKVQDDKNGHRLFAGSDGRLYVADRSGATPDSTEDGPLMLAFPAGSTRKVVCQGEAFSVPWPVMVRRTEKMASVSLSFGCACEAARRMVVNLTIEGYPIDTDEKPGGGDR